MPTAARCESTRCSVAWATSFALRFHFPRSAAGGLAGWPSPRRRRSHAKRSVPHAGVRALQWEDAGAQPSRRPAVTSPSGRARHARCGLTTGTGTGGSPFEQRLAGLYAPPQVDGGGSPPRPRPHQSPLMDRSASPVDKHRAAAVECAILRDVFACPHSHSPPRARCPCHVREDSGRCMEKAGRVRRPQEGVVGQCSPVAGSTRSPVLP
jgi:hypothetical protein